MAAFWLNYCFGLIGSAAEKSVKEGWRKRNLKIKKIISIFLHQNPQKTEMRIFGRIMGCA